jgi:hypothetical protein
VPPAAAAKPTHTLGIDNSSLRTGRAVSTQGGSASRTPAHAASHSDTHSPNAQFKRSYKALKPHIQEVKAVGARVLSNLGAAEPARLITNTSSIQGYRVTIPGECLSIQPQGV